MGKSRYFKHAPNFNNARHNSYSRSRRSQANQQRKWELRSLRRYEKEFDPEVFSQGPVPSYSGDSETSKMGAILLALTLAASGVGGGLLAKDAQDKLAEKHEKAHAAKDTTPVYRQVGDPSQNDVNLNQFYWQHKNTPWYDDDVVGVSTEKDSQYGFAQFRNGSVYNGEQVNSGELFFKLMHDCDPKPAPKCIVDIDDLDNDGHEDSIKVVGRVPGNPEYQAKHNAPDSVVVENGNLTINGNPVQMKGVDYDPGEGPLDEWSRDTARTEKDLQNISDRGANFVELDMQMGKENMRKLLDQVAEKGLKAVVDVTPDWPVDYSDPAVRSMLENRTLERALDHQNSTGLGLYSLGTGEEGNNTDFYNSTNNQIKLLDQIDSNHAKVVKVSDSNLVSASENLTEADMLLVQLDENSDINSVLAQAANISHPLLLRYGAPSFANGETNESYQAVKLENFLQDYMNATGNFSVNQAVQGLMLYDFIDQLWKYGPNGPISNLIAMNGDTNLDNVPEEHTGLYKHGQNGPEPKEAVTQVIKAYDQTPPAISVDSAPADGENVSARNVTINVSVAEPNLARFFVGAYDENGTEIASNQTSTNHSLSLRLEELADGNYTWRVEAEDVPGHLVSLAKAFEVYLSNMTSPNNGTNNTTEQQDVIPPMAWFDDIVTPGDNATINLTYIPFRFLASDDKGPLEMRVTLHDETNTDLLDTVNKSFSGAAGELSGRFNVSANRTYILAAVASDLNNTNATENRVIYIVAPVPNGTGNNETPDNNGTPNGTPSGRESIWDYLPKGDSLKYWLVFGGAIFTAGALGYIIGGSGKDKDKAEDGRKAEKKAEKERRKREGRSRKDKRKAERKAERERKRAVKEEKKVDSVVVQRPKMRWFRALREMLPGTRTQEQLETIPSPTTFTEEEDTGEHFITEIVGRFPQE